MASTIRASALDGIPEYTDDEIANILTKVYEDSKLNADSGATHSARPASTRASISKISTFKVPELDASGVSRVKTVVTAEGITKLDERALVDPSIRRAADESLRQAEEKGAVSRKPAIEKKKEDAGKGWFNLPRTVVTPELKRDLQLLQMREVLDPKRHYKKNTGAGAIPTYSQVGTIIEGPADYFGGRLTKKERKQTLLEQVLSEERKSGRIKNKYADIQATKRSGRKGAYKALQEGRQKKFKRS